MLNHSEGDGFAELLNFSHMVAPEVLGLKNGGFLAGFWLTGPDLESSTVQEKFYRSGAGAFKRNDG